MESQAGFIGLAQFAGFVGFMELAEFIGLMGFVGFVGCCDYAYCHCRSFRDLWFWV